MATAEQIDARIAAFPQVCREAGLKVTPQRTAIFAMLAGTAGHPSPDEVYSAIRRETPSISVGTVYKILELFHQQGFIRRVSTRDQVTRYDANLEPHHHLVCSRCGSIRDVSLDAPVQAQPSVPEAAGFSVFDYEIQFHGLCGACRAEAAE